MGWAAAHGFVSLAGRHQEGAGERRVNVEGDLADREVDKGRDMAGCLRASRLSVQSRRNRHRQLCGLIIPDIILQEAAYRKSKRESAAGQPL